jgi:mRNA interferase MazF
LVIGRHIAAGSPALFWVLLVTSATHLRWTRDVEIADLVAAGLSAPSIVRCAKVATIERADTEPIGHLSIADRGAVRDHIRSLLGPAFDLS